MTEDEGSNEQYNSCHLSWSGLSADLYAHWQSFIYDADNQPRSSSTMILKMTGSNTLHHHAVL